MDLVRSICSLVSFALGVYSFAIFARIIVSWVLLFMMRTGSYAYDPQNPTGLGLADRALGNICDPYLRSFRWITSLKTDTIDFTPLVALMVLNIARSVLSVVIGNGSVTVFIVLAIIIDGLWDSLLSLLMLVLVILLFARYFVGKSSSFRANNWINSIDPALDSPVRFVYRLFFKGSRVDDERLVLISAIFYLALMIVIGAGVGAVVRMLYSL